MVGKDGASMNSERFKKLRNLDWDEANDLWLDKLDEVVNTYIPDYVWMDFGQHFVKESHRKRLLANYFNQVQKVNKEVVVNRKGPFFPKDIAIIHIERATMLDIIPDVWVIRFITKNFAYSSFLFPFYFV